MKKRMVLMLSLFLLTVLFFGTPAWATENREEEIYEKSGAQEMVRALDEDTKELLSEAGVESNQAIYSISPDKIFQAISQMLRDKLAGPIKALTALLGVFLLCRLADCFEGSEISDFTSLLGTLACASVVLVPLLGILRSVRLVVESASVFLLASIPVYTGLMLASGQAISGTSYGMLTLGAANAIPLISIRVLLPLLNIFLAFAICSAISHTELDKLIGDFYRFAKWLLVFLVTLFTGILSIQTILSLQMDNATGKMGKLLASSAIPIVGGTFGDALALIKNSMHIVKSGVSAFGILASFCIFLPPILESVLWLGICSAGEILGDLFHSPRLGRLLGSCSMVLRMILAVLISVAAVCVVCAAVVLCVRGGE